MFETEILANLAYLILALTPIIVIPKIINSSKHGKNAIFTNRDVENLRKGHDLEMGYYKATINRLRAQLGNLEKLPGNLLIKAKATSPNDGGAVSSDSITELADQLLESVPTKWRAIFNPIKSGIVKAIQEKEAADPGTMARTVASLGAKLGVIEDTKDNNDVGAI